MINNISRVFRPAFLLTARVWDSRVCQCLRIYTIFDAAIGNLVVLESLRHGTCLRNYFFIQLQGANPQATHYGEAQLVEKEKITNNCNGYFFVGKDYSYKASKNSFFEKRCLYLKYVGVSSRSAWRYRGLPFFLQFPLYSFGTVLGLLHPTAKFRYASDEIDSIFESDPEMPKISYKTKQRLPWHRLGITGSLYHGVNRNWMKRVQAHPSTLPLGVLQLFVAIGLSAQVAGVNLGLAMPHFSSPAIRWVAKSVRFFALQAVYVSAW